VLNPSLTKLISTTISEGWLDASFSKSDASVDEMQNASVEKMNYFQNRVCAHNSRVFPLR
jgi:hypothetical protein